MKRYLVVVERAEGNYSSYIPDVDGCVATGKSPEETVARLKAALASHVELMLGEGYAVPEPTSQGEYIEIELPKLAKPKRKSA